MRRPALAIALAAALFVAAAALAGRSREPETYCPLPGATIDERGCPSGIWGIVLQDGEEPLEDVCAEIRRRCELDE